MKGSVRLGEDVVGIFDFSIGTVSCMQVGFIVVICLKYICTLEIGASLVQVDCITAFGKYLLCFLVYGMPSE